MIIDCYWYLNEDGFLIENGNKRDWIKIQYEAFIATKNKKYIKDVKKCIVEQDNGSLYLMRYPIRHEGMVEQSRDHLVYAMCMFIEDGDEDFLKDFTKRVTLECRLGLVHEPGLVMNPWLKMWLKLHNGSLFGYLWYPMLILQVLVAYSQNAPIGWLTNCFEEVDDDKYLDIRLPYNVYNKWVSKISKLLFPLYAQRFLATQIYHTKKKIGLQNLHLQCY